LRDSSTKQFSPEDFLMKGMGPFSVETVGDRNSVRTLLRCFIAGLISLVLCLVCSCSVTTRPVTSYYRLDYPPAEKEGPAPFRGTLMIYRLLSGPTVDSYSMKIVDTTKEEASTSNQRWEQSPADMITGLLLRDIEQAALFQKTTDQSGEDSYRFALEGTLQNIGGLVAKEGVFAVLEAQFVLIDFESHGSASQELLKRTYHFKIPCKHSGIEAISAALNVAVSELSNSVRRDVRLALDNMGAPRSDKIRKPPGQTQRKRDPQRSEE
jgi:ABC-type uncharacterized transport system auxiliary subunit